MLTYRKAMSRQLTSRAGGTGFEAIKKHQAQWTSVASIATTTHARHSNLAMIQYLKQMMFIALSQTTSRVRHPANKAHGLPVNITRTGIRQGCRPVTWSWHGF